MKQQKLNKVRNGRCIARYFLLSCFGYREIFFWEFFWKFWTVANWFIESHVWTRGSHGTESCDEGGTLGDVGWGEEG